MRRREPGGTGLFFGPNPDRSCATDQREGIVSDKLRRALQFKLDRVGSEWPDGVKFVCDAENHASRVSPVADEAGVVGEKRELLIHALAGVLLHNDLFALNIALQAQ